MDTITSVRNKIDLLDNQIMKLLDERYNLTTQIGLLKQQQNIPVEHTNREHVILNKSSIYSHSPQIESIYKTIFKESKKLQRK